MLKAFRPSSPMVRNWDEEGQSVCMCELKSSQCTFLYAGLPLISQLPVQSHHRGRFNSIAEEEAEQLRLRAVFPLSRDGLWQKPSPYSSNRQHVRGISRHNTPPSADCLFHQLLHTVLPSQWPENVAKLELNASQLRDMGHS